MSVTSPSLSDIWGCLIKYLAGVWHKTFANVCAQLEILTYILKVTDNERRKELVTQLYFRDFIPDFFEVRQQQKLKNWKVCLN